MESDGWPRLVFTRFEDEPETVFRDRTREISYIIEGFRMGRFRGELAERMERRLIVLEEQGSDRLAS